MGLDMYLEKKIYIGGNYDHNQVKGVIDLKRRGSKIKINLEKVTEITEEVHTWRKANAIHNWFVENVQDGKDDCKPYFVEREQLETLVSLCKEAYKTKDGSLLPTQSGFFFGSTDYDEYYFDDLNLTVEALDNLDDNGDYYYSSSW